MKAKIRRATFGDRKELTALASRCAGKKKLSFHELSFGLELCFYWMYALMGSIVVLEYKGKIIGMLMHRNNKLGHCFIDSSFRRRGAASTLLVHTEKIMKAEGRDRCEAFAIDTRSKCLLEKHGYQCPAFVKMRKDL